MVYFYRSIPRYKVVWPSNIILEVTTMKNYDFQDLMIFGMFLLALLTFIFMKQ